MEAWTCPNCRDINGLAQKLIKWAAADRIDFDFVCFFCGSTMPSPHLPNCLHILSVEYLEKHHDSRDRTGNTEKDIGAIG